MKKHCIPLALALLLALVLPALTAARAEDDYPYSDRDNGVDEVDPWRFYYGGCTSFVAWRLNQVNGVAFDNFYGGVQWGNAAQWGAAARSLGIPVDSTPAAGSVYWQDAYVNKASASGHVAWVKEVLGAQVVIEQYASGQYNEMTVPTAYASGYIHIRDLGAPAETVSPIETAAPVETAGPIEEAPAIEVTVPEREPPSPSTEKQVLFPRTASYTPGRFTDVAGQWFAKSVAEAYELGLMKGNGPETFDPDGDVTIAEAVTMAARIHSIYTAGEEDFPAPKAGQSWYQPYLDYALVHGVIDRGCYDCDVTQKANRAQFAVIFASALPEDALPPINQVPDWTITDVLMTDPWAEAVYKLYRAGILAGGDSSGAFYPLSTITRAQAAAIVSRMADSSSRVSVALA